MSNSEGVLE